MRAYLLLLLLCGIASAAVDLSSKTQYYSNGLTDAFHLANIIVPPPYTLVPITDQSLCLTDGVCSVGIDAVYSINYQGQGSSIACVCNDAVFDINYMADNIGRVPLPLRNSVSAYTVASAGEGGGAYTIGGLIAFFDPAENTEVFIHESAHAYDASTLSFSQAFFSDESEDTCVPDGYASTNDVENFAQLTVTWVYLVLTNNPVPSCMSNSLAYLADVLPASSILATTTTYTTSSSTTASTATTGPSSSTGSQTQCSAVATATVASSWNTGGQVNILITNTGTQTISSLTFAIVAGSGSQITQQWNTIPAANGNGLNLPSWALPLAVGGSISSIGYVYQGPNAGTTTVISVSCASAY